MFTYKNVKFFYLEYYNRAVLFLLLGLAVLLIFGGHLMERIYIKKDRKQNSKKPMIRSTGRSDRI